MLISNTAKAQCSANINTFPYNEGFETSQGNWFVAPNSSNSDWVWATPQKALINGAGGGSKCWISGGATGNSYASNEDSYLQSPCFDISSLINPFLSFKIFFDTEPRFDGGGFQYSTDGGITWNNLGSTADLANCPSSNWYNSNSVRYLSSGTGWSGSSGQWVVAKHSLSNIQGATNVTFRFVFGAGSIANNYNGLAIDDIFIGEAPPNNTGFTFTCKNNQQIAFADASTNCPNNFVWDFGDPASGGSNTSNSENPLHTFSAAGTYTVSFTASSPTSAATTSTQIISVLDVTVAGTNLTCNAAGNGSITATPSGGTGAYNYTWNTTPDPQTQTINNLSAGTYTVTVNASNACPASATTTLYEPPAIIASTQVSNEICGNGKGSATAIVSGGAPPYQYRWSNGQTTQSTGNLSAGNYSVHITDNSNCSIDVSNIIVSNSRPNINLFLGNDTTICPGQELILNAGQFATYLWQDNSTAPIYHVTQTGSYSVSVIDNNGCTASDQVNVLVECNNIYFPSAFTPNNDGRNDGFGPWGNLPAIKNYTLTIYDRWGSILFQSNNPNQKWDGKYKGEDLNVGAYIWTASFIFNNHPPETRKGTITILH